jgi:hypothetical protein
MFNTFGILSLFLNIKFFMIIHILRVKINLTQKKFIQLLYITVFDGLFFLTSYTPYFWEMKRFYYGFKGFL